MDFGDSLKAVRDWLRAHINEGVRCPCCGQLVKQYHRPINAGMAHSLITMYRTAGRDWQHIPTTIGGHSREEGKLRYWGLIEEQLERREDGGRAGWWRVTELGEQWILGQVTVPSHVVIYNGRCRWLEGDPISVVDALGNRFDYRALMDGVG